MTNKKSFDQLIEEEKELRPPRMVKAGIAFFLGLIFLTLGLFGLKGEDSSPSRSMIQDVFAVKLAS